MNNEPEQITPEYVIQPNAISQAVYECGTNARRMIAMAMALLPMQPHGKEDYTVSFTMNEFNSLEYLGWVENERIDTSHSQGMCKKFNHGAR